MKQLDFKKFHFLRNSKGFSIVELLLALALLIIAITLGYNLLFFARTSFERSEERWMEQNEVVSVTNVIYDALNESYFVAIIDDIANVPSDLDFYGAFYVNSDGNTLYLYNDGGGTEVTTEIPGDYLTLLFEKEYYIIGDAPPYPYNDLINMTVISNDLNYTINTQVHLDNMTRDRTIHGDASGPVVVFQTKEIVETVPEDLYDSLCFVATAAYGSPMEPELFILRDFRDNFLMNSNLGAQFVKFYYDKSPAMADVIAGNPVLRFAARAVLYPVIGLVTVVMKPILFMFTLAGMYIVFVLNRRKKKSPI